jgi:quinol monooxygenase YgiN
MSFMSPTIRGSFIFTRSGSEGALDQHTETPHYKQLEQNVRDLLEGAFEVNVLDSLG